MCKSCTSSRPCFGNLQAAAMTTRDDLPTNIYALNFLSRLLLVSRRRDFCEIIAGNINKKISENVVAPHR